MSKGCCLFEKIFPVTDLLCDVGSLEIESIDDAVEGVEMEDLLSMIASMSLARVNSVNAYKVLIETMVVSLNKLLNCDLFSFSLPLTLLLSLSLSILLVSNGS